MAIQEFADGLSEEERRAIRDFIRTKALMEKAQAELDRFTGEHHQVAKYLTEAAFDRESLIPKKFAIERLGKFWLIQIDLDGDHDHVISEIGGIASL